MIIETCAKVNLTLEMLGRRADVYHDLATVFQAVDLCDRIVIEPARELVVTVVGADVPSDERNLCWRAAAALAQRFGREPAVRIELTKHIPVGAGLGGGSGNAAGVLAALAACWSLPATADELLELAAELGSDVAFFLRGGAALGTGRGERLAALPGLPEGRIVILAPAEPVSTGRVYGALDGFRPAAGEASERLAAALREGTVPAPSEWLVNDLEAPAARVSAAVAADQAAMAALGAAGGRLSGSGGAWFTVVPEAAAAGVQVAWAQVWPGRASWITRPVDYGWRRVG